jgi:hypothetical protein
VCYEREASPERQRPDQVAGLVKQVRPDEDFVSSTFEVHAHRIHRDSFAS